MIVMLLAALTAATPAPPEMAEKTVDLPPGRQEIIYRIPLNGKPVRIDAVWQADTEVSVVILEESQFRLRRQGQAHSPLAYGEFEQSGSINSWLPGSGVYLVVVDNRLNSNRGARVKLKVSWQRAGQALHPDAGRARTLVLASSGLFLGLCIFAGGRLRRGIQNRE